MTCARRNVWCLADPGKIAVGIEKPSLDEGYVQEVAAMRHSIRAVSAPSRLFAVLVVLTLIPTFARAQGGSDVTFQLPSFSATGVNTTVLVPDSGTSATAHQRQAAYQRSMYGGLTNQRSLSVDRRAAALSVTAQVHDPRAAEAELLREFRERRATWTRNSVVPIGRPQHVAADALPALGSVADLERDRAARIAARAREAEEMLKQARAARRAGKSGVAAVYYGMAANRANAQLKPVIEAEARQARSAAETASSTAAGGP
jgi:hypothetical protein